MTQPNVVGFFVEDSELKNTIDKSSILKLFIEVEELNLKAIVSEYNDEGCLSEAGITALLNIFEECDIDGIVVVTADDLSSNPKKVLELIGTFSSKGVEVISIQDDLPDEKEYPPRKTGRPRHCTVTIFEE